eukprot:SAG31_NODE_979_length_10600_cov_13.736025_6_plen_187_part_00
MYGMKQWSGIDCRFGWAGINSEAHYDFKRNFVAVLAGWKRWILLPPSECSKMSLLPWGHPSSRHCNISFFELELNKFSVADFAAAKGGLRNRQEAAQKLLLDAAAVDVMLGPGDVLHVPAYWFHNVLSLRQHSHHPNFRAQFEGHESVDDRTVQCNAFMGPPGPERVGSLGKDLVEKCMLQFSGES